MKFILLFPLLFMCVHGWAKKTHPRAKDPLFDRQMEYLKRSSEYTPTPPPPIYAAAKTEIPDPPTEIPKDSTWAPIGENTRTPYGWADLCGRQPQECQVDVLDPVDVHWAEKAWTLANKVNTLVNAQITPTSNLKHWGTVLDHWDYPTEADYRGDCKIYALWKRKLLMDIGFPRQTLLLTIARDQEGNGHTFLTLRTDRGDFVLDNMFAEIKRLNETGYKFVKRQSQSDPNVWVSIGPVGEALSPENDKLADHTVN